MIMIIVADLISIKLYGGGLGHGPGKLTDTERSLCLNMICVKKKLLICTYKFALLQWLLIFASI